MENETGHRSDFVERLGGYCIILAFSRKIVRSSRFLVLGYSNHTSSLNPFSSMRRDFRLRALRSAEIAEAPAVPVLRSLAALEKTRDSLSKREKRGEAERAAPPPFLPPLLIPIPLPDSCHPKRSEGYHDAL